jgi:hypothetical protein
VAYTVELFVFLSSSSRVGLPSVYYQHWAAASAEAVKGVLLLLLPPEIKTWKTFICDSLFIFEMRSGRTDYVNWKLEKGISRMKGIRNG